MANMNTMPSVREMQTAYQKSDSSYDGIFFLAVRTTGIFCRPSCRARKPRPENVALCGSVREPLFAGFRPCKRCRPLAAIEAPPPWAQRLLAEIDANPAQR